MALPDPYSCVRLEKKLEMIVDHVTNLEVTGVEYTAGCGIDETDLGNGTITVAVDGVSVICEDGVLKAVAASDLTAGCGITIDTGVISAAVDGTTITCEGGVLVANAASIIDCFKTISVSGEDDVVADSGTDTLTFVSGDGIIIETDASTDAIQWSIDFTAFSAEFTGGPGIDITSLVWTADIWADSHLGFTDGTGADDATDAGKLAIQWHEVSGYSSSGDFLYGTADGDSTKPVVRLKTTEDWLERLDGYSSPDSMVIGNDPAGDPESVKWIPSPQKVIWGIDPDGGHTIETSGTTLTLTLKVTKYTFDAVNFESAVDDEVEIVYSTGTECE